MATVTEMPENFRDAPFRWLASLYFLGAAIAALMGEISIVMLALGLAGLVLFAPPLQRLTTRRWDFAIKGWRLVPVFVVFFIAIASLMRYNEDAAATRAQQKAQQEKVAASRAVQQDFAVHKGQILQKIENLASNKEFDQAIALGQRYLKDTADAELQAAVTNAQKKRQLWIIGTADEGAIVPVANAYDQLVRLEPDNKEYVKQAAKYAELRKAAEAKLAAARAEAERREQRAKMLEKQFSPWDGSHPAVVAAVKRSMKNPDSYKHVETRYRDLGSGMRVQMIFRGTNSFGGIVPNTVVALVDDDGNVVSLEQQ